MSRLLGVLLACVFALLPTADVLCRSACTPRAVAAESCHEHATSGEDGIVAASTACQPEAVAVVSSGTIGRALVTPAPPAAALTLPGVDARAVASQTLDRGRVRARPDQACPSCIVLRI